MMTAEEYERQLLKFERALANARVGIAHDDLARAVKMWTEATARAEKAEAEVERLRARVGELEEERDQLQAQIRQMNPETALDY